MRISVSGRRALGRGSTRSSVCSSKDRFPQTVNGRSACYICGGLSGTPKCVATPTSTIGAGIASRHSWAPEVLERWGRLGILRSGPLSLKLTSLSQPYPSWEGLREIVYKGANAYREVLKPSRVERIGLRYINEIKFGSPRVELEDYFDFHPLVGSNLPQDFSRFHCFVQLEFEDNRDSLILQIGSKPDPSQEGAVIVLDLDYFLADPSKLKIEESTDWIEKAHANLESVFEGCLKDRVRELFH